MTHAETGSWSNGTSSARIRKPRGSIHSPTTGRKNSGPLTIEATESGTRHIAVRSFRTGRIGRFSRGTLFPSILICRWRRRFCFFMGTQGKDAAADAEGLPENRSSRWPRHPPAIEAHAALAFDEQSHRLLADREIAGHGTHDLSVLFKSWSPGQAMRILRDHRVLELDSHAGRPSSAGFAKVWTRRREEIHLKMRQGVEGTARAQWCRYVRRQPSCRKSFTCRRSRTPPRKRVMTRWWRGYSGATNL